MTTPVVDIPVLEVKPLALGTTIQTVHRELKNLKVPDKIIIPVKGGKVIDAHAVLTGFRMEYEKDDEEVRSLGANVGTTFTANQITVTTAGWLKEDTGDPSNVVISCLLIATIVM